MRIVLFDAMLEQHLGRGLAQALRGLGHSVSETGPLTGGITFDDSTETDTRREAAVASILEDRPDAVIVMRSLSLDVPRVMRLRAAGIHMAAFFGDDPVLYGVGTGTLADAYDLTLHAGGEAVLALYDSQDHPPGVHFPFWADPADFPYVYHWGEARDEVLFFGNIVGRVKAGRYAQLAALQPYVRMLGRIREDPLGLNDGFFEHPGEATERVAQAKLGLNVPQAFAHYVGSRFDFPGLAALGCFELPSRLMQYGAWGLPTVTLGEMAPSPHWPEALICEDATELRARLPALLADEAYLTQLSRRARRRFEGAFTAAARAAFLDALLKGSIRPDRLSLLDRAFAYRDFGVSHGDSGPGTEEEFGLP